MGGEQTFLEHDCDKDLVGGHLGFATFNLRKCFSVENLSCPLEYDEMMDGGNCFPFHFFFVNLV